LFVVVGLLIATASCGDDVHRGLIATGGGSPDPAAGQGGSVGSGAGDRGAIPPSGEAGSGGVSGTGGSGGPSVAGACADIFADDQLPTYEIQIAPADWTAIVTDFNSMQQNINAGLDYHPWHPLAQFKYGNEIVPNAMIRLKGWSSWWQSAEWWSSKRKC